MAKKEKASKVKKDFRDQFDDEDVLFTFRKHPIVMRMGLVVGMAAWLVGPLVTLILTYTRPDNPPSMTFFALSILASMVLGVLVLFPSWIAWYFSVFIVTNQRFIQITQKGFFNKSVVDIGLSKIQSTNYEVKGIQATLLGFGTIMIQTYMGDLVVHEVHHPAEVIRKLSEVLRSEGIEAEEMDPEDIEQQKGNNEEVLEEI